MQTFCLQTIKITCTVCMDEFPMQSLALKTFLKTEALLQTYFMYRNFLTQMMSTKCMQVCSCTSPVSNYMKLSFVILAQRLCINENINEKNDSRC
ncbi:hypothetical protein DUNSADRAFT_1489 [Dunaliella salina]|uniref:Encoded protein n=1 Tax=Dunaliella salina TaxID=3046 RepID=A0ABQ7FXE9_DUNSA|nr:hypothetical protein DUNSADRAFT_1489 [Dunaliella salina]|eukprot:KAF5827020.1 hypothetical protein DUNSADRAFT_1489 [Dunaliella salina]